MTKLNKKMEYKLSEQAQLSIVSLFQKALVTMQDVSEVLDNLRVVLDEEGCVEFSNPELCELSEQELEKVSLSLVPKESYKNLA